MGLLDMLFGSKNTVSGNSRYSKDMSEKGLRSRLEAVIREQFPEYELRINVEPSTIGATYANGRNYTYGMFKDGIPMLVILVLNGKNEYCRSDVKKAHEVAEISRVKCLNFMSYLPSTYEYISDRLKNNLG